MDVDSIAITQRSGGRSLAAFDVAAFAEYNQPARPGADSDLAFSLFFT
jgi:hypothetical protein